MIDEILYMQTRIFRMFCERTGLDPKEANRLFCDAGVWDFIANCYDALHTSGDEYVYEDVMRLLRNKGRLHASSSREQRAMENNPAISDAPTSAAPLPSNTPLTSDLPAPDDAPMPDSVKYACADLMFTDAVETLARRLGVSTTESRSRLIESGAYAAMYDLETGLWAEGPDYFIGFYEGMPGVRRGR